jgi:uncharacterized cupredoxin-like copper-binding protein
MRRKLLILALLLLSALSACGGSQGASTNLKVTMTDFMFTPNQFTVPAGKEITLDVSNSGAVVHNFIIMNLGQTAGTTFTDDDDANVYWKLELQPGGSNTTTFTAPTEPGEYEVVCSTPGHLQAGMVAKMIVVASE